MAIVKNKSIAVEVNPISNHYKQQKQQQKISDDNNNTDDNNDINDNNTKVIKMRCKCCKILIFNRLTLR